MGKIIRKNKKFQRAVKIFTDRVEPRNAFWNAYETYKKIMNDENLEAKVVFYYGMGGIGKSRLLTQLQAELESQKKSYCVTIDFDIPEYCGMLGCFGHIWKGLKHKYRFSFPLYAAGLTQRAYLKQEGEKIDEDMFRSLLGETADDIFDIIQQLDRLDGIPYIEFIPKGTRLATKGINWLIHEHEKTEYEKELLKIKDKKTIQEIEKYLPYLLGLDIEHNMASKKEPLVIFLDTYEKLGAELENVRHAYVKDDWLKGDDGLILNVAKVLWVIAGREKLKWAENDPEWTDSLEQHLVESISEPDAVEYLEKAGIPETLHHGLYERTHGVPVFLDLSVDTYYQIKEKGEEPSIDNFGYDKETIVERYIRYLSPFQKTMMYTMAFLRKWPTDDISMFNLFTKELEEFDDLAQSSCIRKEDGMSILHEVVGEVLRKVCPGTMKKKICDDLLTYFKERITKIEEDDLSYVYSMRTVAAVALDYYAPEKVGEYFDETVWPEIERLSKKADRNWGEICETIYHLTSKKLDGEHLVVVKAMHELARSLRETGKYQEAFELAGKVLEICRRIDDEHPRTTAAMNNLSIIMRKIGRYQDSVDLAEKVLERCRKSYADKDYRTVAAIESLARSQSALGFWRQPYELRYEALEICKRVWGENDPITISAMLNWSCALNEFAQYEEAYEVGRKGFEYYRRTKGETDIRTYNAMVLLAVILNNLARYEDACEMQKKVVEVFEKTLIRNHPYTLDAKFKLAQFLSNCGRYQDAYDLIKEVLKTRKEILGDNHPDTIATMDGLAMTLYALGQNQKGVEMEKEALEKRIVRLGETHPDTVGSMSHLALKLRELGREEEACKWEEKFWNHIHEMNTPETLECEETFFRESKFWNTRATSKIDTPERNNLE